MTLKIGEKSTPNEKETKKIPAIAMIPTETINPVVHV